MKIDEYTALQAAIAEAIKSPCAKSKRGVVIFIRGASWTNAGIHARGFNEQPHPMKCDGSAECKAACSKLCVHAEASALVDLAGPPIQDLPRLQKPKIPSPGLEMLHVKVVDDRAVPSGPPSCWQCSRLILKAGIKTMWLLHDEGLRPYTAHEFHTLTLENCGLPVLSPIPSEPSYDTGTKCPGCGMLRRPHIDVACPGCHTRHSDGWAPGRKPS